MKKRLLLFVCSMYLFIGVNHAQSKKVNTKEPTRQETIDWIKEKIKNNLQGKLTFSDWSNEMFIIRGKFNHSIDLGKINSIENWYCYSDGKALSMVVAGNKFHTKTGYEKNYKGVTERINENVPRWDIMTTIDTNGEENLCARLKKAFENLVRFNQLEKKKTDEAY